MGRDLYHYFRMEARDIVEQLSRGIAELERGSAGEATVAHLLRLAHTLKGAAHVVKQGSIANLAHQFEDVLVPFSKAAQVPPGPVAALFHLADAIVRQLAGLDAGGTEQPPEKSAPTPGEETFDTVRVEIAHLDALLEGIVQSAVQVNALKGGIAGVRRAVRLAAILEEQLTVRSGDNSQAISTSALAKARSTAEELQVALKPLHAALASGVEDVERELEQIRNEAAELRLVSATAVFSTLERAVRNSAQALGKKVAFDPAGGENSLDAHVLGALRDSLLHLVRNAVAHGIESPAERSAAGKPDVGKVTVRVARRGNRVAFACSDDGRGFDVAALRHAAAERGLISGSQAESLDAREVVSLILRGGVSTSSTVSEISGRGIGLDVVRQTAAQLNGDIDVTTEAGKGSTIEVTVPVSLLSLDTVLVESGGVAASLPIEAVQETLRLRQDDIVHNLDNDSIVYVDRAIPFLPLVSAVRQPSSQPAQRAGAISAVVIRSGGDLAAIGVDRVLGTSTVILHSLPDFAGVDPVIAGASIDAEGNPQMVLDPASLVSAAHTGRAGQTRTAPAPTPAVLVIDDSLTTRMLEQSILESAGYEVDTATSGEEALQKARARRYSLFVVDIEMPGMDGFEFIERTRSDAALHGIPSILVTSRSSEEDRRHGMETGARAYIVKGEFDQGALLDTIQRLVS